MGCTPIKCKITLTATGYECTPILEVAYKLIAQPTYDSTGARNGIPITATLNQAYFQALIDETDASKKWYVIPPMKNIEDVRGDNKVFDFDDQSMEFLFEGARKFMAMVAGGNSGANSPQMKGLIEQMRGGEFSFFIVTVKNQLVSNISDDGTKLEGIEFDSQSLSAQFVKKTNATPQHLKLSFNWSATMQDASLRLVDCDQIGGANLTALRSPIAMCYELVDQSATTLKIKISSIFGSVLDPNTADGLVVTDFISSDTLATSKIYNATDDLNVTITGVVESPDGTYELTFAGQTPGDVLVPYAKKSGFDFECMKANPVDVHSS